MTGFMSAGRTRNNGHPNYGHFIGRAGQPPQMAGGMTPMAGGMPPPPQPASVPPPTGVQQGGMSPSRLPAPAAGAPQNTQAAGTSGVMGFDLGGAIPDDADSNQGLPGTDDSPNVNGSHNISDAISTVDDILDYGRNKNGLGQLTANVPTRPAGPGGDQQDTSPFPIKRPNPPFGKQAMNDQDGAPSQFADGGPVDDQDDDDDETGAIPTRPAGPGGDTPDTNPFPTRSGGFGKRYDDGGSVDDDDDDDSGNAGASTSGAIPDGGDDSQGAAQTQQQAPAMGAQPDTKKLVSYLMGADASPAPNVAALERAVDPQGQLDPDTRHILAINQAAKQGGQEAAWGVMQHYRKKYDAYKSFAAAALNGVQGKPPDIAAAAQAATQAYTYMPDGTTVQFQPGQSGVTATVKKAGVPQPMSTVSLSVPQFNDFVKGRSGQYDNVMENSGPRVLAQLQQSQGSPVGQPQQGAPQGGPPQQGQPQQGQAQPQPQSPFNQQNPPVGQPQPAQPGAEPNLGDQAAGNTRDAWWAKHDAAQSPLEKRSRAMFSVGQEPQRQAWLAAQEQQQTENETNETKAKRPWEAEKAAANQRGRANVAGIYTASKERQGEANNQNKALVAFAAQSARSNDSQLATLGRIVTAAQNSVNPIDPDSQQGKAVDAASKELLKRMRAMQGGGQQQGGQQGGGQPPKPGAKQDPQGNWREKGPDGLWHLIQQ